MPSDWLPSAATRAILNALLDAGADPNIGTDMGGQTPLVAAARDPSAVALLTRAGAKRAARHTSASRLPAPGSGLRARLVRLRVVRQARLCGSWRLELGVDPLWRLSISSHAVRQGVERPMCRARGLR